jgi:hypothetical protein
VDRQWARNKQTKKITNTINEISKMNEIKKTNKYSLVYGQAMGKNLCSMCGFDAPYTCRITGLRLCRCGVFHAGVGGEREIERLRD